MCFMGAYVEADGGSLAYPHNLLIDFQASRAQMRVTTRAIFPNCPRYIPEMQLTGPSIYAPQPQVEPPEPAWKGFDMFKDAVHPRQPTFKG